MGSGFFFNEVLLLLLLLQRARCLIANPSPAFSLAVSLSLSFNLLSRPVTPAYLFFQLRGYNTAVTGDDGVERDTAINEAADMLGEHIRKGSFLVNLLVICTLFFVVVVVVATVGVRVCTRTQYPRSSRSYARYNTR